MAQKVGKGTHRKKPGHDIAQERSWKDCKGPEVVDDPKETRFSYAWGLVPSMNSD